MRTLVADGRLYAPPFKRKDVGLRVPADGKTYVQALPDWAVWDGQNRQQNQAAPGKPPSREGHPAFVNYSGWQYRATNLAGKYSPYNPVPPKWQKAIYDCIDWSTDYILPKGKVEYFFEEKGGYTSPNLSKFPNSGLFSYCTANSVASIYERMIRKSTAFTDSWSYNVGASDSVLGINEGATPYTWLTSPFIFQLFEVEDRGADWLIKTLDMRDEPPTPEWMYTHPQYLSWTSEIHVREVGDGYAVSNFSYAEKPMALYGRGIQGLAVPFMTPAGWALIKKNRCTPILKPGTPWSPYYLPRY